MNLFSVNSRHRLVRGQAEVDFRPARDPEGKAMPVRRVLIMHFTAGWSADSTVEWWRRPEAKGACAHLIIDRDGSLYQVRPFNQTAGHAGVSRWMDRNTGTMHRNLNHCAIGIELCNVGVLPRQVYPVSMPKPLAGRIIPFTELRHKHGGPKRKWEIFPEIQLETARQVADALVRRYQLDDVLGHDDVAPDRKEDPGPAFPMIAFRSSLGFAHPLPAHNQ
jgi:N-acetylmuramoyl-L-alanine amidase